MKPIVEAQDLELFTPAGRALAHKLSFKLEAGELLLVEGPNGAGKSTLLKAILGLHKNFRGKISSSLNGEEISYLPQLGNVQFFLPLILSDVVALQAQCSSSEIENLGLLGQKNLHAPWNSASGGERQKALLTRCLLSKAKLFILDEPLNHLDQAGAKKVQNTITALTAQGKSVLLVSHSAEWTKTASVKRLLLERRAM